MPTTVPTTAETARGPHFCQQTSAHCRTAGIQSSPEMSSPRVVAYPTSTPWPRRSTALSRRSGQSVTECTISPRASPPPFRCGWCSPPGVTRKGGAPALHLWPMPSAPSSRRAYTRATAAPPVLSHSSRPRCSLVRSSRAGPMARAATRSAPLRLLPGTRRLSVPGTRPSRCRSGARSTVGRCAAVTPAPLRSHACGAPLRKLRSHRSGTASSVGISGSDSTSLRKLRFGRAAAISTGLRSGRNPSGRPVQSCGRCQCAPLPKPLQGPGLPSGVHRVCQVPMNPHRGGVGGCRRGGPRFTLQRQSTALLRADSSGYPLAAHNFFRLSGSASSRATVQSRFLEGHPCAGGATRSLLSGCVSPRVHYRHSRPFASSDH